MEDATIITTIKEEVGGLQTTPLFPPDKFPALVDTDDMVFEMGRLILDKLNKEKVLNHILELNDNLTQQVADLRKAYMQADEGVKIVAIKAAATQESNQLYETNNRNLSNEITSLRASLSGEGVEVIKLKQIITELEESNRSIVNECSAQIAVYSEQLKSNNEKDLYIKQLELGLEEAKTNVVKLEKQLKGFEIKIEELTKKSKSINKVIKTKK